MRMNFPRRPTASMVSTSGSSGTSVLRPRSAAYFAASAAGAKETTSTRGSASRRCVTERAQEATPASAPQAPGRLGRGDARNFGCGTLDPDDRELSHIGPVRADLRLDLDAGFQLVRAGHDPRHRLGESV